MRRTTIALIGAGVVLLVALNAWEIYRIHALHGQVSDMRWSQASDSLSRTDSITPDVGSIQFIKGNTFSIELERVAYNANGLYLKGKVGNASNISVSNLTLNFTATKPVYEMKADFDATSDDEKEAFAFFGSPSIGTAQSAAVTSLPPGTRADFEVTIPNVRQTSSGIRLAVYFSGERYSYGY